MRILCRTCSCVSAYLCVYGCVSVLLRMRTIRLVRCAFVACAQDVDESRVLGDHQGKKTTLSNATGSKKRVINCTVAVLPPSTSVRPTLFTSCNRIRTVWCSIILNRLLVEFPDQVYGYAV